jgi:phage terminase large subunit-like protein
MLDWQRELLWDMFGTVDIITGARQYRRTYASMAKKNGKSFLVGGLPIYHLIAEEGIEAMPMAYGAASARDQAAIVFRSAAHLVKANPYLGAKLKIIDSKKIILRRDGGPGQYIVLSADGDVQDGIEPSLAIIDELHRWKTKKAETLYQVLSKGTISRNEPLLVEITTAGEEHESPLWFGEHEYARQVIEKKVVAPHFLARIWAADSKRMQVEPEYWKSREARVAANPSHQDLGGFLKDERLVEELSMAIAKPETKTAFLRLNLNVPVAESETPAIVMDTTSGIGPNGETTIIYGWRDQPTGGVDLRSWPTYDVELLVSKWGLEDRECYAGVDSSWNTDLSSLQLLFPPLADNEPWKMLGFNWLPEQRVAFVQQRTRQPLNKWAEAGFLATPPGIELNPQVIIDKILWAREHFNLREVSFDKACGFKAAALLMLVPAGITCIDIPQNYQGLSAATKWLLGAYMGRRLQHGNHPILDWHAACLSLESDGSDNVKPHKPARDKGQKRIDGIQAAITAAARAQFDQPYAAYEGLMSVGSGAPS